MPSAIPGPAVPDPAELSVINDPGNEDPGSLLDDARVPLQEAPDEDANEPDPHE